MNPQSDEKGFQVTVYSRKMCRAEDMVYIWRILLLLNAKRSGHHHHCRFSKGCGRNLFGEKWGIIANSEDNAIGLT